MINTALHNGIAIVNKSKGMTSYDIVRKMKRILGTSKIGHTGTLDPLAEGVMIVCAGKTTKLAEKIEAQSKVYIAEMTFGIATDTYDTEGRVIKNGETKNITKEKLEEMLKNFTGECEQVPPMYSALKVNGQKLYELARKGIEVERKSRKVTIEYIKLIHFENERAIFEAKVSKGTYIRSLINDIGERLGCFAVMSGLKRIAVGDFSIKNSYTVEEMEEMGKNGDYSFLIGVEKIFEDAPEYIIKNDRDFSLFINGNTVITELFDKYENVKVYYKGEFIGIGKMSGRNLKGDKYF